MKIGILSDIHGNASALVEVLHEAKKLKIERLFILGDIVGYYYEPDKVLELLKEWNYDFVRGNHEEMLSESIHNKSYLNKVDNKYGTGIRIALEKLNIQEINFLINSPTTKTVIYNDVKIMLCHGSPWDINEYIYPDANIEIFERCSEQKVDFILMGHTHYPFISFWKGVCLMNPGSVGQARDKGKMASWAIFDTYRKVIVFKRTCYDFNLTSEQAKTFDSSIEYNQSVLIRS